MNAGVSVTTSLSARSKLRKVDYYQCSGCGEEVGQDGYQNDKGQDVCRQCAICEVRPEYPLFFGPNIGCLWWLFKWAIVLIAFFAAMYGIAYAIGWVLFTTGAWKP